MHVASLSHSSQ
jgi:hypothetical protein